VCPSGAQGFSRHKVKASQKFFLKEIFSHFVSENHFQFFSSDFPLAFIYSNSSLSPLEHSAFSLFGCVRGCLLFHCSSFLWTKSEKDFPMRFLLDKFFQSDIMIETVHKQFKTYLSWKQKK